MELGEVDSITVGMFRGELILRMNREVGMVAFIGEEGRHSSGGTRRVVVGEFSQGE